ncbi:hypothetical protein BD289DRAFT_57118 [Coniella lustricola]|uniref:Uncharacterized protein n=1 Tax=Coniella lustricola TaxID=2025994 RepID=A0A2T3AI70_9PEZI|nr:hypothetical protein BD289DRAFT_57118 [Coniella lustricola]
MHTLCAPRNPSKRALVSHDRELTGPDSTKDAGHVAYCALPQRWTASARRFLAPRHSSQKHHMGPASAASWAPALAVCDEQSGSRCGISLPISACSAARPSHLVRFSKMGLRSLSLKAPPKSEPEQQPWVSQARLVSLPKRGTAQLVHSRSQAEQMVLAGRPATAQASTKNGIQVHLHPGWLPWPFFLGTLLCGFLFLLWVNSAACLLLLAYCSLTSPLSVFPPCLAAPSCSPYLRLEMRARRRLLY